MVPELRDFDFVEGMEKLHLFMEHRMVYNMFKIKQNSQRVTMEKLYSRGSVAISPDLEYLVNDVKKMNFLLNIVSCYDSDYCLMLTNMLATEKGNEQ